MPAAKPIDPDDLVIHVLNVGFGDNILLEFPVDDSGKRSYGLVDCYNSKKTKGYLEKLIQKRPGRSHLRFVCATHPHLDHIKGIRSILTDATYCPEEFWESGFRHNSVTYQKILEALSENKIRMVRVSSGMEQYFGKVRITVLSPSVALRNRYATYGVDMNNASVVLRLEHHSEDVLLMAAREYKGNTSLEAERKAGQSVVILAGDAEFDSWAQISQEYPKRERTSKHDPLVKRMVNYLSCAVVKVAHHGSMHSAPLDIYEKMKPELGVVSSKQRRSKREGDRQTLERGLFPHQTSTIALEECDAEILTTDGSHDSQKKTGTGANQTTTEKPGSVVVVVPPGGKARWKKLKDKVKTIPDPPTKV
ncbi:hypothetical protein E3J62_00670 [candidate division TA06 bacterium]|uniref:PI-PLC Y-box domain-containing protein n=1 Tax=candidate division TA06 bacterium TaxID=2250710 RepID=A0A523UZ13_UNCT6|nr:MAG: hypothetical protein E3J62_00670 [candidate division TA06 bacterium]